MKNTKKEILMPVIDIEDNCPSLFGMDAEYYKKGFTKNSEEEPKRKIRIYRFKK